MTYRAIVKMHYLRPPRFPRDRRPLCGTWGRGLLLSLAPSTVNCARCLAKLEKLRAREMGVTR